MMKKDNHEAPWLDVMVSRLGTKEIKGTKANPEIVAMYADVGHPEVVSDEVAWCAAAMGSALVACNLPVTPKDVSLLARSYCTYGLACKPKPGAIAIWPRGKSSWQGHVNIVESVTEDGKVICVGGNQSDAVTRTKPMDPSKALAFRWPIEPTVKALRKAGSTEIQHADTLETAAAVTSSVGAATAIVKEATQAVPDTTPLPPLIPDGATEHIGAFQTVMEAFNAMAKVVLSNPWLAAVFVGSLAALWLARVWKQGRLDRHLMGLALSSEAKGGTDA